MSKIKNILNGWENFIAKSEVVESLARVRAEICSNCPKAKKSVLLAFVKDSLKEVEGYKCAECQCPLSAKLRSKNEVCPLGQW